MGQQKEFSFIQTELYLTTRFITTKKLGVTFALAAAAKHFQAVMP